MANITIQIPDAQMANVTEAFTNQYGYQEMLPDPQNLGQTIPNPETKPQFVQRMLRAYVKDTVAGYRGSLASQTAAQAARDQIG